MLMHLQSYCWSFSFLSIQQQKKNREHDKTYTKIFIAAQRKMTPKLKQRRKKTEETAKKAESEILQYFELGSYFA